MKHHSIIFLLFYFPFICLAQGPLLLNEEFNDNKNHWPIGEYQGGTIKISNSYYILNSKERAMNAAIDQPIDGRKDFIIETTFTVSEKSLTKKAGFYIYNEESDTYLTFYLTYNGGYYVQWYANHHSEYLAKPALNSAINKFGVANTIKLEQKGPNLLFYCNNVLLTIISKRIPGVGMGYEVSPQMTMSVERLLIYQDIPELTFVKGFAAERREHLSKNVNSTQGDLAPILSPDGKYLFISRREDPNDVYDEHSCDDVWISEKQANGSWGPAKKMPYPINDQHSNDIIAISPDNNTLFLADTSCRPTNQIRFFVSHRTANGWSKPVSSIVENGYNLSQYFCATVSTDGQVMLASFTRNHSYGSSDIYLIRKVDENNWAKPINLGTTINSFGFESSPFLAADGVTLYFSSNGHRGLGSYDIFMSRRLDDTWTNWSAPENLGPIINSDEWDMYFSIDAKAEYAYLSSSDKDSYGGEDIYRIKLPKEAQPHPVTLIAGKVLNGKTKQPVQASIIYEDLATGKKIGEANSNPANGEFKMILPCGKSYGYHANAKGFIPVSENLDLASVNEYNEMAQNLFLIPIEVGGTIKLNNVFFEQGKDILLQSSYSELDRLIEIMKTNMSMEIELRGHTDNQGNADLNLQLSEKRVKAVKNYLISKGISAARIQGVGFGGSQPVASNASEETRRLNRRVEFVILKK